MGIREWAVAVGAHARASGRALMRRQPERLSERSAGQCGSSSCTAASPRLTQLERLSSVSAAQLPPRGPNTGAGETMAPRAGPGNAGQETMRAECRGFGCARRYRSDGAASCWQHASERERSASEETRGECSRSVSGSSSVCSAGHSIVAWREGTWGWAIAAQGCAAPLMVGGGPWALEWPGASGAAPGGASAELARRGAAPLGARGVGAQGGAD